MSVLPLRLWPDPVLREETDTVGAVTPYAAKLAADMLDTMYAAPGRGLAGPQIGVSKRIFVMDAGWKEGAPSPLVFIDPEIVEMSDARATGPEGCLSLPGVMADVERAQRVRLRWTDETGARQDRWLSGFEAVCAQHEYDHLDGILIFDRIAPEQAARLKEEMRG